MKTADLWEEQSVDLRGDGARERATISELASSKIQNQQHAPTTTCVVFRERERERERGERNWREREKREKSKPLPVAKISYLPKMILLLKKILVYLEGTLLSSGEKQVLSLGCQKLSENSQLL
jgi:hypothetical protein